MNKYFSSRQKIKAQLPLKIFHSTIQRNIGFNKELIDNLLNANYHKP